tara:strand:- start:111 stop:359 length:249 start_codon:yes stop_codon:yes gene_type:complete
METKEITSMIKQAIPNSEVNVVDLKGTGDHFSALIISDAFEGVSLVDRHKMIYNSISDVMTTKIHAMQIKTLTKNEWAKQNG